MQGSPRTGTHGSGGSAAWTHVLQHPEPQLSTATPLKNSKDDQKQEMAEIQFSATQSGKKLQKVLISTRCIWAQYMLEAL